MLIYACSLLSGILLFSSKNTLIISGIEWLVIIALLFGVFILFKRHKSRSIQLLIFVLGFAWMAVFSNHILNHRVDNIYLNKPINVVGTIAGLPKILPQKINFVFNVEQPFKAKIKLSWYGENLEKIKSGSVWQLLIKIKHNNGYQNIGGFDYEKWLFYEQIDATGYVRKSIENKQISAGNLSIDRIRQNTRDSLSFLKKLEFGGVINALIIGDRSLISKDNWELFKATNTTHLTVISGLHIGLISGLVFLLAQFLWRLCMPCMLRLPAQVFGAYFGLLSAFLYTLIAGFSIPTGRAFIMAAVVFVSLILRRHHNIWQLYGLALILVLLNNPLSIFSAGFWLSFYVVGVIIYSTGQHKNKSYWYRMGYLQLLISIATLPLIAWFFASGSVLSPVANLVAIPIFSFIVTPLSLIGALLNSSGLVDIAQLVFEAVNQVLIGLGYFLAYLVQFDFNHWHYAQTSVLDLSIFILAILIAISPAGLKLRWLSILILALMLLTPTAKIDKNSVLISVLDVGQGLANIVQTQNHILLFDTGAAYRSGFNMGEAVITPFLRAQQIRHLDKIIISHGDNDHIGGLTSVLSAFNVGEILSSVPHKITQKTTLCQAGQSWEWDGVLFEMLNPVKNTHFTGNNASCVLKISTHKYSILLTADIERGAERQLIKNFPNKLNSDIMLSPHHGSKTSSGIDFLQTVAPEFIIISSGYQNRFNHPAKKITHRYNANNISFINTNCAGQIQIKLGDTIYISEYRKNNARYYMRQCK